MHNLRYLPDILVLLGASVFIVVLLKKLRLSPVLGYLVVGAAIGEHGFNLIKDYQYTQYFAEFGVVFLLFVIGLELTFERLIQMRLHVFGFGGLQIAVSTLAIVAVLKQIFMIETSVAVLIAAALALSSTAIILQVLAESKRQSTQVGRLSLAVLLMQDFAVVPLLAILPLISGTKENLLAGIGLASLKALVVIILISIAGRLFLRPLFSLIGSAKSEEVYVSATLLIVLGAAMLTNELGLSTAMGAFIAGLLIAETEYRNKVESSIMPFKSLLLGLFFMTVGMSIDINFILGNLSKLFAISFGLLAIKAIIVFVLCKIFRFGTGAAIHSGLLLSQGGEFAFVLFGLASQQGIIGQETAQFLFMLVAITMAVTPLLSMLGAFIEDKVDINQEVEGNQEFKGVSDLNGHVIIAGFGRVGRVVGFMLSQEQINYVAVDSNYTLVKQARTQGFPVYHGELSKIDTLRAVGAERAAAVILTMDDKVDLRKAVKTISTHYKNLEVIARVQDYREGKGIRKLGADIAVPSTIETGLQLGGALLKSLGIVEHEILTTKEKIRKNDYILVEELELFSGIINGKPKAQVKA
ncbi:Glutathione regulate potassium efflux protein KefB [Candidatus Jidaibacter acanthamoeba]|uniref:Glutathione regulate potassium efflux protein KefB n=1 Tax=Candidatus Jidaibacter acanthamoebae TaxID=86105 RepID=A0A0C1MX67_9RICK|nr:monovalent cation:proton antiporter-2 (CPA2) family protein [Candidatus Jidaibacter acanthamoeba]KIE04466.1 Glutathione regulate potassium efflux protein KefB [Candidatus Jidaibacter acanthamoeba]